MIERVAEGKRCDPDPVLSSMEVYAAYGTLRVWHWQARYTEHSTLGIDAVSSET
jgi:hypothetical protein